MIRQYVVSKICNNKKEKCSFFIVPSLKKRYIENEKPRNK